MQKERDDFDNLIESAFKNVSINENYNEKLMQKLHEKQLPNDKRKNLVPSLALITAGLFILLLSFTNLQTQTTKLESCFSNKFITTEINRGSSINFIKQLGE